MNTDKQTVTKQHTFNEQGFCVYCHNVHQTDNNASSTCSDGFTCAQVKLVEAAQRLQAQHDSTAKPTVKFLKNGIRDAAGDYYPCWYSLCRLIDGRTAITVYARSLSKGLPAVLQPENDTDMMTDYFDKDRVRFYEGSAEFEALKPFARI